MGRAPALPAERTWSPLIELAIAEDVGAGDATSALVIEPERLGAAVVEAREALVVCGMPVAHSVFRRIDPSLEIEIGAPDGALARG